MGNLPVYSTAKSSVHYQDAWSIPEISGMLATEGVYLSGATY